MASTSHAATDPDPMFTVKFSGSFYAGGEIEQPIYQSAFNLGNHLYQISEREIYAITRLNFELAIPDKFIFVAKPRAVGTFRAAPILDPPENSNDSLFDGYFQELYAGYHLPNVGNESTQISVGRQNYEWGPAETLSPSNFFFPQLLLLPRPFDEVLGQSMARMNLSFGLQWSWILIEELPPLHDYYYQSPGVVQQTDQNRFESKTEFNWDNGAKYLGLTFGRRTDPDRARFLGGGYFSMGISDALQIYGDAQVSQGSPATFGVTGDTNPTWLSVTGLKYTFVDGTEFRFEYLYNQAGYNSFEQNQIQISAPQIISDSSSYPTLPGVRYLYGSIRSQASGIKWNIFHQPAIGLRSMISLTDGSNIVLGSLESGFSDRLSAYVYGGACGGATNSELRRLFDYFAGAAAKVSF